jgi:MoxR-like ATPase
VGAKLIVYGLIALFVGVLAWQIVATYNGAIERAERAEAAVAERDRLLLKARTDLKDAEATNKAWEKRLAEEKQAQDQVLATLAERDRERAKLTKERNDARASLAELRRADPTVEAWAATPLPPAILARLRGAAAATGDGGRAPAAGAGGRPPPTGAPR